MLTEATVAGDSTVNFTLCHIPWRLGRTKARLLG